MADNVQPLPAPTTDSLGSASRANAAFAVLAGRPVETIHEDQVELPGAVPDSPEALPPDSLSGESARKLSHAGGPCAGYSAESFASPRSFVTPRSDTPPFTSRSIDFITPRSTFSRAHSSQQFSAREGLHRAPGGSFYYYEEFTQHPADAQFARDMQPGPPPALPLGRGSGRGGAGTLGALEERRASEATGLVDLAEVYSAARHGHAKRVEQALAAGFDPNTADAHGNTLFHVACQNGNKRIAKLAIKHGGDWNAVNLKGNTGIHFLFAFGYASFGEYFIEKGARDDLRNEHGLTCSSP